MMVEVRKLLNHFILDDGWVMFQGDSEYVNEDGELVYGMWTFHCILDGYVGDFLSLDSLIDDSVLFGDECLLKIRNDRGKVCLVEFHYSQIIVVLVFLLFFCVGFVFRCVYVVRFFV